LPSGDLPGRRRTSTASFELWVDLKALRRSGSQKIRLVKIKFMKIKFMKIKFMKIKLMQTKRVLAALLDTRGSDA
jgi:hypothetical protein